MSKDDLSNLQDLYGAAREHPEEVAAEEIWVAGQHPGRYSAVQCSVVQNSTVQCSARQ